MIQKAELTNKSMETLSTHKELSKCLFEYIWNGFDGGASKIDIVTKRNDLNGIESIIISDNGCGIIFENLQNTFKRVLDSDKIYKNLNDNLHGSKGKGRFSFINFADSATWTTTYTSESGNKKYKINILRESAAEFTPSQLEATTENTGTSVELSGLNNEKIIELNSEKFLQELEDEYSWFLYLNKEKKYEIYVDGQRLDYMEFIDASGSQDFDFYIDGFNFEVNLIKWSGKIKENYYFYFRNSNNEQVLKKHTGFNKKKIIFPHSVYIKSNYFDKFTNISSQQNTDNQIKLIECFNENNAIFKALNKKLIEVITNKLKLYTKQEAPKVIKELEEKGAFPEFKNNKYDQLKKEDLKGVVTELFIIHPSIFEGNLKHKKTLIAFLNLLLDSDEREGIINIMDNITNLSSSERDKLNDILKKTTLSRIVRTITMLENRLAVIEVLKKLVYNNSEFTNERDHIQQIIEENYWLFGEQYNLVSADIRFETALKNYVYILDGKSKDSYSIDNEEKNRRPDIFMCRSRNLSYESATEHEENIIVELKAPRVKINKDILRQIEDYMDLISNEPQFNSDYRKWKFIAVSKEVDDYIKGQYGVFQDKGKRFLVKADRNFELYAMTWDDVFKSFEINHNYILKKLNLDKELITADIENLTDKEKRELSDELTKKVQELEID